MIAAAAIVLAVWIVLAAMGATGWSFAVARLKRRAREFTDWTLWQPDVPHWCDYGDCLACPPPAVEDDYLDGLPADCLSDDEIRRRCERMEQYL